MKKQQPGKEEKIRLKRNYDLGLKILDLINLIVVGILFGELASQTFEINLPFLLLVLSLLLVLYIVAWFLMRGGDGSS